MTISYTDLSYSCPPWSC